MSADITALLRRFLEAYDALQASDGASAYLDAESSRTFTAGAWLGQRMAGLADDVRKVLAGNGSDNGTDAKEDLHNVGLTCALCGCHSHNATLEEDIHDGWVPSFFVGNKETGEEIEDTICPECVRTQLDDELRLIEDI
jgi:hypothetical protein